MRRTAGRFGSFPEGGETLEKGFTENSYQIGSNIIIGIFVQDRSKLVAPASNCGD